MREFWLQYGKVIKHYCLEGLIVGLCIIMWQTALYSIYEHFGYIKFYQQILWVGFILFYFLGRSLRGRYSRFFQ